MDNKFVSLADVLGIEQPKAEGVAQQLREAQADASGVPPKAPRQVPLSTLCKEILSSIEYREHLYRLIVRDALPPAIETMLYHYAEGKPVERLEVSEKPVVLDNLTAEELEARVQRLQDLVKVVRAQETSDEPPHTGPVH